MEKAVFWVAALLLLLAALNTYRLFRKIKFLKELLRREKEQSFAHYNRLVMNLSEAFSRGAKPTLEDLARDIDREFELK